MPLQFAHATTRRGRPRPPDNRRDEPLKPRQERAPTRVDLQSPDSSIQRSQHGHCPHHEGFPWSKRRQRHHYATTNTEDTVVYHHLGIAFVAVDDFLDEKDILELLSPANEEGAGCFIRFLLPRYDKPSWRQLQSLIVAVRDQIKAGQTFEEATAGVFQDLPHSRERATTRLFVCGVAKTHCPPRRKKMTRTSEGPHL